MQRNGYSTNHYIEQNRADTMKKRNNIAKSGLSVVYCRVSTTGQADDGVSLAAQEAACRRWAESQSLQVLAVCVDAGISGAADIAACPGLVEALALLKEHPGTTLVAYKRDRFARDVVKAATLERLVAASGGAVATVEGVAGDGPEAALMRMIVDAFASYERALVASRTRAALAHKKAKGERVGTVPRGFRADESGRLVPDEHEQRILTLVRDLRATGMTLRAIAEELDRMGFKTRRGRPYSFVGVGEILRAA